MTDPFLVKFMLAGTLLFFIFVCFIVGYIFIYYRRQQLHLLEKSRLKHNYEKELLSTRLEEQERAMNQISREIHDNVGQKLDLLQMNTKAMRDMDHPPALRKYIENNEALAGQLSHELRNVSYSLNSDYVSQWGLGEVIEKELSYVTETRKLECSCEINGSYRTLPGQTELLIYRIFQEALHNALKHAKANHLRVLLDYTSAHFKMEISDDGAGCDLTDPAIVLGLGLRNMEHRARLAGGTLDVKSAVGKGCTVLFTMALQEA